MAACQTDLRKWSNQYIIMQFSKTDDSNRLLTKTAKKTMNVQDYSEC